MDNHSHDINCSCCVDTLENVYVIDFGDGETFKIGFTRQTPEQRMSVIEKTTVLMPNKMRLIMSFEYEGTARHMEQLLHMKFRPHRVNGEWFKLGFVELLNLYQSASMLALSSKIYDGWYDLVPDDYMEHLKHNCNIDSIQRPYFTVEECKKAKIEEDEALNAFNALMSLSDDELKARLTR